MYEYDAPPPRLRVRFTADANSSTICAIASIQSSYVSQLYLNCMYIRDNVMILINAQCPVVELLDNPDHRGRYQTMRALAAINTKVCRLEIWIV